MKYDLESSLDEIGRRKNKRLLRRARDKTLLSGGITAALAVLTVLSFVFVMPHSADELSAGPYGSFLVGGGGGGYVLVGVIAFAFGAAFTLLCIRLSKLKQTAKISENSENDNHSETNENNSEE